MISVKVKSKYFETTQVLGTVHFDLSAGEAVALTGPSGIGKSTLLRIVAGIDSRFEGQIQRPEALAMVFQEPNLLPWRNALQNITLCHPQISASTAHTMLDRVGLSCHKTLFPGQLSLGQQRRLSLARAFVGWPALLIMDEPFASLDEATAEAMLELTKALMAEVKPAALFVTHNKGEIQQLATRMLVLHGRPATLAQDIQDIKGIA